MKRFLTIVLLAAAVGCGQTSTPTLPDQTHPSVDPELTVINGVVPVGGIDTQNFTVNRSNGTLLLTFVQASPPAGLSMGVGLGQPVSGSCSIGTSGIVAPDPTTPIFSSAVSAGTYCIVVGDIGQATGPVSYTMNVSHY